jgi:16S rRNA (guanine527-N7)-methyltransferase
MKEEEKGSKMETKLDNAAKALGYTLNTQQINRFIQYYRLIKEWNQVMNLTAIEEEEEFIEKHFLDSLTCLESGVIRNDDKVIDVGTGAGFPGIPLKIYFPQLQLTLLDSLQKRTEFLKKVVTELEMFDVEILHGRAEDYGRNDLYRELFDLALSRAVAELRVLNEFCLPFVKVGGHFIAMKGPKIAEERDAAVRATEVLGGKEDAVYQIELPYTQTKHFLYVVKKITHTPEIYPRRAGIPGKRPL